MKYKIYGVFKNWSRTDPVIAGTLEIIKDVRDNSIISQENQVTEKVKRLY